MKKMLIIGAGLFAVVLMVLPGSLLTDPVAAAAATNRQETPQQSRAAVSISGRVLYSADPSSRGLSGTTVVLTDTEGNIRTTRTNPFGFYRFTCVQVGEMYVVSVTDKRLIFEPQVIGLDEEVIGLDFVALP
jgi:hypothetical protein